MPLITGQNAYLDTVAADLHFADRLHVAAWTKASAEDRDRALMMATAALDRLDFRGYVAAIDQRLAWPRDRVCDREGRALPTDRVPVLIEQACAEWALHLLATPPSTGPAIRSKTVGDLRVDYAASTLDAVPSSVRALLAPVLRSGGHDVDLIP